MKSVSNSGATVFPPCEPHHPGQLASVPSTTSMESSDTVAMYDSVGHRLMSRLSLSDGASLHHTNTFVEKMDTGKNHFQTAEVHHQQQQQQRHNISSHVTMRPHSQIMGRGLWDRSVSVHQCTDSEHCIVYKPVAIRGSCGVYGVQRLSRLIKFEGGRPPSTAGLQRMIHATEQLYMVPQIKLSAQPGGPAQASIEAGTECI